MEESSGIFVGRYQEQSYVTRVQDGYEWHRTDGTRFGFNEDGCLTWIEDPLGNRRTLSYDPDHQFVSVADEASGRSLIFEYNPDGLIARILGPVTDAVLSVVHAAYAYIGGKLTSVIRADGSGYEYTYDDATDSPNLIEKRDRSGHFLSSWAYDAYGSTRIYSMDRGGGRSVISYISGFSFIKLGR